MQKRPNILLITSDQQHWNTIGKYFSEIDTPNLDRLAAQGMHASRAYCPNPTCTPTRASILTGQYPSSHGAWSLGTKLPEAVPTVGESLQRDGYDCSLIGKAHLQPLVSTQEHDSIESYPLIKDLGYWKNFQGPFYGFNHVELARHHGDETHVGQHYALWLEEKGLTHWQDHFQNTWEDQDFSEGSPNPPQRHSWSLPEEYHSNTWITERSIARMREAKAQEKPFFLWASYFDPHPPYVVPEPWASMYDPQELTIPCLQKGELERATELLRRTQNPYPDFSDFDECGFGNHGLHSHLQDREELAKDIATYYGMVSFLDHQVGKLLDELEEQGVAENTLVVFTSDHGHYYGHHGLTAKGPFHFEDGIRVPFIASWPGHIPAGQETSSLISLVDLAPTFLSAAGSANALPANQGIDQLSLLLGRSSKLRQNLIVEHRAQKQKLYLKTVVTDSHKLTVYLGSEHGELYDLSNDPDELKNLWDEPEAKALRERLLRELVFATMRQEAVPMPRLSIA